MTLQEAFMANKGQPVQHEGRTLYWTYWMAVETGQAIEVKFVEAVERPVQGLGVVADHCVIDVHGTSSEHIALWADTAPMEVAVRVLIAEPGARVGFFNQWRDAKYGTTLYRLNDAAMEVERGPGGAVTLRCSDGIGGYNPKDLIVGLRATKEDELVHERR